MISITKQIAKQFGSIPKFNFSLAGKEFQYIKYEQRDRVALITLHRPKALNALCDGLINELNSTLEYLDTCENTGAIVITGSEKAFAAGADIKEMSGKSFPETYTSSMLEKWDNISQIKTPIIAAVNGFALGGGCELAMLCDIIIAGDNAQFGQPEIKLGTMPGCGGTVRLTHAMGKSKSMEYNLTANFFDAQTAEQHGLVSRVVPAEKTVDEALELAAKIASYSKPISQMIKESVNMSHNLALRDAIQFEKRIFHSTFGTKDRKEGMAAFIEKRKPTWEHN